MVVCLVLVTAVLASISALEYAQIRGLDSSLNSEPPIPPPCKVQVSIRSVETPVLLMQPGTTGYICVTLQSAWQGSAADYQSDPFISSYYQFGFDAVNASCVNDALRCGSGDLSNSFTFSASPSSIRPTAATDYVTVVYSVTALGNSTGFYDYGLYGYCGGMPMAVGYSISQVNASDFVPAVTPQGCYLLGFYDVAVSVGPGMSVAYVALG